MRWRYPIPQQASQEVLRGEIEDDSVSSSSSSSHSTSSVNSSIMATSREAFKDAYKRSALFRTVDFYLSHGYDVNATDAILGYTILHHLAVVRPLLPAVSPPPSPLSAHR